MTSLENRFQNFLTELSLLSTKYGLSINACGCCSSPFLEDWYNFDEWDDPSIIAENLSWDGTKYEYSIVKWERVR